MNPILPGNSGLSKVPELASRPVADWRRRRRDRVLAAASDLFAQRPYALVSMDHVARAAMMGKATLYRYFSSKEDLYVAVFEMVLDRLAQQMSVAAAEGGGPIAVLKRLIAILAPTLAEHSRALRAIDDELALAAERKRRVFRDRRQSITSRIEEAITAGIASGALRPVRAAACAHMIVGMIWNQSAILRDSSDNIAEIVADVFLNGVLARPGR